MVNWLGYDNNKLQEKYGQFMYICDIYRKYTLKINN